MTRTNKIETEAFLLAKPADFALSDFAVPAGYRLVANKPAQTQEGETQIICLIYTGGEYAETVYKVKTIVRNEPNAYLPIKNCTQLVVWRQITGLHGHVLSGFARTVFNFLLRSHSIMITDEQQTEDGKRFWLDRMGESFAIADRDVYYVNLNELDNEMSPVIKRIDSSNDLMENYIPNEWGADEEHKNRAFIISTQEIS